MILNCVFNFVAGFCINRFWKYWKIFMASLLLLMMCILVLAANVEKKTVTEVLSEMPWFSESFWVGTIFYILGYFICSILPKPLGVNTEFVE